MRACMKARFLSTFVPALVLGTSLTVSALAAPPQTPAQELRLDQVHQRFGPAATVRWDATGTAPKRLGGLHVATAGHDAGERAVGFVRGARDLLALGDGDVTVLGTRAMTGRTSVELRPTWRGLPVEGRTVVVTLDAHDQVTSVTSDLGPLAVVAPSQPISAEAAQAAIQARYSVSSLGTPSQVVLATAVAGRLAWKVPVVVIPLTAHFTVWVDAADGSILREAPVSSDQAMKTLPRR